MNEQRTNSGILFRNHRKVEGTQQPDANGKCSITCVHCKKAMDLEIAGWIREGQKEKFTSLKFQEPRKKEETPY